MSGEPRVVPTTLRGPGPSANSTTRGPVRPREISALIISARARSSITSAAEASQPVTATSLR